MATSETKGRGKDENAGQDQAPNGVNRLHEPADNVVSMGGIEGCGSLGKHGLPGCDSDFIQ
jgi:hypothetical protein